jgi:23S rRNA (pseudouridine1915-N3)-methyltransferase
MRLVIAAVGRFRAGGEADLVARYAGRIDALGRSHALGPLDVIEIAESRASSAAQRRAHEAEALLKATTASRRIVLDERGKSQASQAFADFVRRERDGGAQSVAFLIGGPDGHGEAVRAQAALILSLSTLTLSHGLARVVLAEQIYRALTIIAGHPYHRA